MSRAQEIKEKQILLAKLQQSFSNATSEVLKWIDDTPSTTSGQVEHSDRSKKEFYQLPVIQIGSGLSFDAEQTSEDTDIHTIGEFIQSDKKVSSLAKKKRASKDVTQRRGIHHIRNDDSHAMVSLKHKIRNQERQRARSQLAVSNKPHSQNSAIKPTTSRDIQESSSSDDEELVHKSQKHSKKQLGLLFAGKKFKKR